LLFLGIVYGDPTQWDGYSQLDGDGRLKYYSILLFFSHVTFNQSTYMSQYGGKDMNDVHITRTFFFPPNVIILSPNFYSYCCNLSGAFLLC